MDDDQETLHPNSRPLNAQPNLLLRNRMATQGLSKNALSHKTGVDERSIQRWLNGEAEPQARNARIVAAALDCEPMHLWPDAFRVIEASGRATMSVSVYASRAHIPVKVWQDLFAAAKSQIDICVYGGTFLFDTVPGFNKLMRDAAGRGVSVRFMAGDPGSVIVHQRGMEENIGTSLACRCALTLDRLAPISDLDGIEIRTHGTPLYVSLFRADDVLIANHHIHGSPASDNPALILHRDTDQDLWEKYVTSFEGIWAHAHPAHRRE